MPKPLDPRIEDRLAHWLQVFEFHDYFVMLARLPKKERKHTWAKCNWFHENKEVTLWFAPTVGLSDANLDSIIVHELAHGKSSLTMMGPRGSIVDEQFCNWMTRVLVPEQDRHIEDSENYTYTTTMTRPFTEEERDLLLDVMPVLVTQLPEPYRSTLIDFYYRGLTLQEIAEKYDLAHHSTAQWRRDHGLELLRRRVNGGK